MAERQLLDEILLGMSALGGRGFRNNAGVAFHHNGDVVRYGVGMPGGSDLIGWMPLKLGERQLAIFTAVEAKTGRQKLTDHQARFLEVVREAGGLGLWGSDPVKILAELRRLTQT
jgi:VRR-NUC domain-containing protein